MEDGVTSSLPSELGLGSSRVIVGILVVAASMLVCDMQNVDVVSVRCSARLNFRRIVRRSISQAYRREQAMISLSVQQVVRCTSWGEICSNLHEVRGSLLKDHL